MINASYKKYSYISISAEGTRIKDSMYASSSSEVVSALLTAGQTPLHVKAAGFISQGFNPATLRNFLKSDTPTIKIQNLSALVRQLYQMLRSGIPIVSALISLAEDQPVKKVSEMLKTISERITSGSTLQQAFSGFPKAFDSIFIAYLAAAEESGDLVAIIGKLSNIINKRAEIQRKVKGVVMYPILVLSAVAVMLTLIMLFLVPRYASIYDSFNAKLPLPTTLLVSFSSVFPIIILILGTSVFAFVTWNKSQKDNLVFGTKYDSLKFRTPIIGGLSHKLALMRFSSTAGGAILAGVQVHDAIDLAARASGSRWIRSTVTLLQETVRSGKPLSGALKSQPKLYPANFRKMISTGEETGELGVMCQHAGQAVEDEIDVLISTMSAKVEVGLLIIMGLTVGSVLIALYLPILNLTSTISKSYGL